MFKDKIDFHILQRCSHFDYRPNRSTSLIVLMVILSPPTRQTWESNVRKIRTDSGE